MMCTLTCRLWTSTRFWCLYASSGKSLSAPTDCQWLYSLMWNTYIGTASFHFQLELDGCEHAHSIGYSWRKNQFTIERQRMSASVRLPKLESYRYTYGQHPLTQALVETPLSRDSSFVCELASSRQNDYKCSVALLIMKTLRCSKLAAVV